MMWMNLLWLSTLACMPDYQLLDPKRSNLEEDPDETFLETEVEGDGDTEGENTFEDNQQIDPNDIDPNDIVPNLRLDAAIQHMGWGEQLTRCQIEVAFQRRHYQPREEDPNQGPPPERPEEPGQCVFHREERPQGDPNGGNGGNGNNGGTGGNGGGSQPDDWFISGDLSGPDVLYLHSLERTITLQKVRAEDGMIRYEMADCRQETFPFGEIFDLEIPESNGNGNDQSAVPAAYIEAVLAFGPDIIIETPETDHMHHQYQGYASDGLYFSWDFAGPVPDMIEERMAVRMTNNSNQPWVYNEGLDCIPDTRYDHQLWPEDLLQFTLSQYLGEGIFSIGLNVHGDYYGPEREDPWGNIFRARVNIMRGGMIELTE